MNMEYTNKTGFARSITLKGIIVGIITIVMLVPGCLVQELIGERMQTRDEAVRKIDAKWSYDQTVSGPILAIPYSQVIADGNSIVNEYTFNIIPENLDIKTELFPEERYYGIYKTILYKSIITIKGSFSPVNAEAFPSNKIIYWNKAYMKLGVSDLRGISDNIKFKINGETFSVQASGKSDVLINEVLLVNIGNLSNDSTLNFDCEVELKGSHSINFLPTGKTTTVSIEGAWPDPGFIGNYTPDYTLGEKSFKADWRILHFNRSIPDSWIGNNIGFDQDMSFGVNLVDTVDIYQQNMRSAKYSLMFIALTFVVFFFVEIIGNKRIHPIQYLLVSVALILFYSLLLSISEALGFGIAYLISSIATIGLITGYTSSVFKNTKQTISLSLILTMLYSFLYVILQLEQVALLAGSIGLFIILGIIMYFARKINWYNE